MIDVTVPPSSVSETPLSTDVPRRRYRLVTLSSSTRFDMLPSLLLEMDMSKQTAAVIFLVQEGASVLSVDGEITKIAHVPHGEGSDREIIDVDSARGLVVGYGCEDSDSIGRLQISIAGAAPEGVRSAG